MLCVVGRARCVVGKKGCRGFARPPINVPTTGQRGVGSTEAEPFGKDEGIDLSEETGLKMNLLFSFHRKCPELNLPESESIFNSDLNDVQTSR